MDGERDRLNQRISQLTEQLAAAKMTIHNLEAINVRTQSQAPPRGEKSCPRKITAAKKRTAAARNENRARGGSGAPLK